jgi:hypothetical protein
VGSHLWKKNGLWKYCYLYIILCGVA